MTNYEKDELRRLVLLGLSVKRIEGRGFKRATIKKYYKTFNPARSALSVKGENDVRISR